ncbi:DUF4139 domain-containing protein [Candidatus Nitrosacidococcus sp. I8]|uniref:DUF4139 domain-containing protein n=1 Tax=Candidatus Nitrosacidococcus sp. I8 TaxID=2942908 RepID=UPI0022271D62|nr:DUF4139 domain-containing protein [Candidatus Nitrosacidococcus sp. I8]CAH9017609.1 hypothetical protein NURINAE_00455 [Candidatus Nitrosacidococcus sp. I8]
MKNPIKYFIFFILLFLSLSGQSVEITKTDREKLFITIYNKDIALVRDQRQVSLEKGNNVLTFVDISPSIQPESAMLVSTPPQSQKFKVIEHSYDENLLNTQNLLLHYLGKKIEVIDSQNSEAEKREAVLFGISDNYGEVILSFEDGHIETGISSNRLIYPRIPKTLKNYPTLTVSIDAQESEKQSISLNYLSHGLSWNTNYIAQLNQEGNQLMLTGRTNITNQSGMDYSDSQVQLVAGDIHHLPAVSQYEKPQMRMLALAKTDSISPREEPLSDYHLYTLPQAVTLKNNQTKQIPLFDTQKISGHVSYEIHSDSPRFYDFQATTTQKLPVISYFNFENSKKLGLGIPLPVGVMQFYQPDSEGHLQFIGEDLINHTPENSLVTLNLGHAFDITAEKKQGVDSKVENYIFETTEITLYNQKEKPIEVKIVEFIPDLDSREILSENYPHQQGMANRIFWHISVPEQGKASLIVKIKIKK